MRYLIFMFHLHHLQGKSMTLLHSKTSLKLDWAHRVAPPVGNANDGSDLSRHGKKTLISRHRQMISKWVPFCHTSSAARSPPPTTLNQLCTFLTCKSSQQNWDFGFRVCEELANRWTWTTRAMRFVPHKCDKQRNRSAAPCACRCQCDETMPAPLNFKTIRDIHSTPLYKQQHVPNKKQNKNNVQTEANCSR